MTSLLEAWGGLLLLNVVQDILVLQHSTKQPCNTIKLHYAMHISGFHSISAFSIAK